MTVGLTSINKGLGKCEFNFDVIKEAINDDWSVLAEGAQTYLKANDEEIDDPYGLFKNATRGIKMTQREWVRAVSKMPISKTAKEEFRRMTPEAYIGFAPEIALETAQRIRAKRKISA
jgi:adenylosuccinate lyase